MYKGVPYRVRPASEWAEEVRQAAALVPDARRVFLADGDVMALGFPRLRSILDDVRAAFPLASRISLYANGRSILAKSKPELEELRRRGLHTLYMGLESGDQSLLDEVKKGETAEEMIAAAGRAQACGLRMSVMILIGLAGPERSAAHADATADALNRMQPRLLSALRFIPILGTELGDRVISGEVPASSEDEAISELGRLISRLSLRRTVFRANHRSNVIPLEGRLPRDQASLLRRLGASRRSLPPAPCRT